MDNSSDDTSNQKVNPLNGTVTVIYKGDDGLNIRKAPSIIAEVDQVVYNGVFTVVGISADEKWYKLKSGLYVTSIPEYVSFKATEEQKASTAGTGYFRVRKAWSDIASQIGAFKNKDNAVEMCKQNEGYKVFDNEGKEIYPCVNYSTEECLGILTQKPQGTTIHLRLMSKCGKLQTRRMKLFRQICKSGPMMKMKCQKFSGFN